MRCSECDFWSRHKTGFAGEYGDCTGLNDGDDVDIICMGGWDGCVIECVIETVETHKDFFCAHYKKKGGNNNEICKN